MTNEIEWARTGTAYSPQSRADKEKRLPGGIYRFVPTLGGWYLNRVSREFEFPFKVYDASRHVIDRIVKYWATNGGNLGVLMNGLRGAGKTMTAQLLANRLVKEIDIPVLVVREPIPLQAVLEAVHQHMMVIFDEFEKSHEDKDQQELLSTIDGMSRSSFNRLFVFTTNRPSIDENFRDRPSRIHYQFEFQRVADEIIEGLMDDSLPKDLHHFKSEIFDFLNTRTICTIDIVKAVISEVRTFRESPVNFEEMLNISKGEPPAFIVEILDPDTNAVTSTFHDYFKIDSGYGGGYGAMLSGNKRSIQNFVDRGSPVDIQSSKGWAGTHCIRLLEKCDEDDCWLAQLRIPGKKTFYSEFEFVHDGGYVFWLDNRPKNWEFPYTPASARENEKERKAIVELWHKACSSQTLYGTRDPAIFKIKVTPNREAVKYSRWKPGQAFPTDDDD